jgi:hypothetical protein
LYPNAGRVLLEAGAGLIVFGNTAASQLVVDALKQADSDSSTSNTPGGRVEAAIETLESVLEDVVRLAASEQKQVSAQGGAIPKSELMEAAKLLFCNY